MSLNLTWIQNSENVETIELLRVNEYVLYVPPFCGDILFSSILSQFFFTNFACVLITIIWRFVLFVLRCLHFEWEFIKSLYATSSLLSYGDMEVNRTNLFPSLNMSQERSCLFTVNFYNLNHYCTFQFDMFILLYYLHT